MNSAIETYINSLFTPLPRSADIERARHELLQMSEDKYNELIAAGVSPNEATGRVITEFGNLEEVADALGIRAALEGAGDAPAVPEVGREEAERAHDPIIRRFRGRPERGSFFRVDLRGARGLGVRIGEEGRLHAS